MKSDVTIFSIPKPFAGKNSVLQRNAVMSWLSIYPRPNIYLLGDEPGIKEVCEEFGISHIKDIEKNIHGTPLLHSAFEKIQELSSANFFIFVNTDIIMADDVCPAINRANTKFNKFLIIGHRRDSKISSKLKFKKNSTNIILKKIAEESAFIQRPAYKDYFIFTRNLWENIPEFAIGRASYDNALVYKTIKDNIPVIDASNSILAVHQDHDYSHLDKGKHEAYKGKEAKHNYMLSEEWVGKSVVGQGYIDSSTWYIDENFEIKHNDENRRDIFRQVQLLYHKLKNVGWDDKYELYSKKIEYTKFINTVSDPAISIIVVSWRLHPDTLKNFEILQQQRDQKFELIFVNNGADDKEFLKLEPFIDTYVKLNDNTGPCFARNFGAVFAKAPIVCFLEDDGIPENNYIKSHLFAHGKYDIHACFGSYFPKTKNPLNARATHYFRGLEPFPCPIGLEGNTSIKSSIFYSTGGWDEDIFIMRDGLALSLRIAKYDNDLRKIIYFPYSLIYHDYARDDKHFVSKMKYRDESQKVIETKYLDAKIYLDHWKRIKDQNCIIKRDGCKDYLYQDKKKPLVSIIFKVLDCADKVIDLVKKFDEQSYLKIEFVIPVCANSIIDESKLLKKNIRLVRINPDYSAEFLNKCIEKSQGEYILFLYPKDQLINNTIKTFVDYSFLFSKVDIFYSDSSLMIEGTNFNKRRPVPEFFDIMSSLLDGYPCPEPLFFIRKKVFISNGFYNDSYVNHFEYEFLARIAVNKQILFKRIDATFLLKMDAARIERRQSLKIESINEQVNVFDNLVEKSEMLSLYPDYDFVYDIICQSSESELEDYLHKRMKSWKFVSAKYIENKRNQLICRLDRKQKESLPTNIIDNLNYSNIDFDDKSSVSEKKLSIAMITPYFWPVQAGMEIFFHNLATSLTELGHKVILFAPEFHTEHSELDAKY
ncbi:MAG: glycosyltransferase family 2 protein, partial [bacterium]